jgi:hypothetical protein
MSSLLFATCVWDAVVCLWFVLYLLGIVVTVYAPDNVRLISAPAIGRVVYALRNYQWISSKIICVLMRFFKNKDQKKFVVFFPLLYFVNL